MLEFTQWAVEIITKADEAARRLNPDARIRLVRTEGGLQASLTDAPEPDDQRIGVNGVEIFASATLSGLVDIEEPHDRIVLRPAGSTPNPREH